MTADLVRYCRLNAQPSLFYVDVSLRERITFYVLTLRSSAVVYYSLRFLFVAYTNGLEKLKMRNARLHGLSHITSPLRLHRGSSHVFPFYFPVLTF